MSRFAFPVGFLLFVAGAVAVGRLPVAVLGLDVLVSGVSFIAFLRDKSAARRGAWRTAESTLHFLSLIGGWPGALVAQDVFHHKTRKRSFQIVLRVAIVLNIAALVWLLTPFGAAELGRILDAIR